ncbi:MAG TPA: glucose 1-dehydrogenase [Steroidobacteraceae bacterium]|nr:glucose 1-dehydrogenase [Steroidobacteraceae bacterium]
MDVLNAVATFDLTGKRALVSGGGTGLGRQFALTLAGAGAEVVLAARRRDPLEATAAEIRARGGIADCIALDVTDATSVDAALAGPVGRVDVLINNAGTAGPGSLLEMTEETWDRVLDVNVKGAWLLARAAARQMIERNSGGSIVNVASVLGVAVQKWTANYPASKAALLHLTRAMALDWARYGIRVNALLPGYFATEMSEAYLETEPGRAMLKRMPMRRLGEPAELGGALLLLASDASRYMTGSSITVDGGLSIPFV